MADRKRNKEMGGKRAPRPSVISEEIGFDKKVRQINERGKGPNEVNNSAPDANYGAMVSHRTSFDSVRKGRKSW